MVENSHHKSNESDDMLNHEYLITPVANWSSCGKNEPKQENPAREPFLNVNSQPSSMRMFKHTCRDAAISVDLNLHHTIFFPSIGLNTTMDGSSQQHDPCHPTVQNLESLVRGTYCVSNQIPLPSKEKEKWKLSYREPARAETLCLPVLSARIVPIKELQSHDVAKIY